MDDEPKVTPETKEKTTGSSSRVSELEREEDELLSQLENERRYPSYSRTITKLKSRNLEKQLARVRAAIKREQGTNLPEGEERNPETYIKALEGRLQALRLQFNETPKLKFGKRDDLEKEIYKIYTKIQEIKRKEKIRQQAPNVWDENRGIVANIPEKATEKVRIESEEERAAEQERELAETHMAGEVRDLYENEEVRINEEKKRAELSGKNRNKLRAALEQQKLKKRNRILEQATVGSTLNYEGVEYKVYNIQKISDDENEYKVMTTSPDKDNYRYASFTTEELIAAHENGSISFPTHGKQETKPGIEITNENVADFVALELAKKAKLKAKYEANDPDNLLPFVLDEIKLLESDPVKYFTLERDRDERTMNGLLTTRNYYSEEEEKKNLEELKDFWAKKVERSQEIVNALKSAQSDTHSTQEPMPAFVRSEPESTPPDDTLAYPPDFVTGFTEPTEPSAEVIDNTIQYPPDTVSGFTADKEEEKKPALVKPLRRKPIIRTTEVPEENEVILAEKPLPTFIVKPLRRKTSEELANEKEEQKVKEKTEAIRVLKETIENAKKIIKEETEGTAAMARKRRIAELEAELEMEDPVKTLEKLYKSLPEAVKDLINDQMNDLIKSATSYAKEKKEDMLELANGKIELLKNDPIEYFTKKMKSAEGMLEFASTTERYNNREDAREESKNFWRGEVKKWQNVISALEAAKSKE